MNFNQLRVFDALARQKSFSKAAAELSISQPTASVHMQNLEQELDLKLVEQLGKNLHLTPAGEMLFSYTRRIFSLMEEAHNSLEELKGQGIGRLLIGASTTPGTYLLPKVLAQFKKLHQQVELHFEVANSALIAEKIAANQLDFGLVGSNPTQNQNLSYSPLWEDKLVAIYSPDNPLANQETVNAADLQTQNFIMRELGSGTRRLIENSFAGAGFPICPAMEFTGTEGVKQAVIANLGVSIVSRASVTLEEKARALIVKEVQDVDLARRFYLVHHRDKTITPLAENFITHLNSAASVRS